MSFLSQEINRESNLFRSLPGALSKHILGKVNDARAIPALTAALEDRDPNVRGSAAEALGKLSAREAVPPLLRLLDDEEWVVFSVIEALGHIADSTALPALMALLKDGSELI